MAGVRQDHRPAVRRVGTDRRHDDDTGLRSRDRSTRRQIISRRAGRCREEDAIRRIVAELLTVTEHRESKDTDTLAAGDQDLIQRSATADHLIIPAHTAVQHSAYIACIIMGEQPVERTRNLRCLRDLGQIPQVACIDPEQWRILPAQHTREAKHRTIAPDGDDGIRIREIIPRIRTIQRLHMHLPRLEVLPDALCVAAGVRLICIYYQCDIHVSSSPEAHGFL